MGPGGPGVCAADLDGAAHRALLDLTCERRGEVRDVAGQLARDAELVSRRVGSFQYEALLGFLAGHAWAH